MKYLSGINGEFHEFFHGELNFLSHTDESSRDETRVCGCDVLDENWPRGLSSIHKIETYEQCFSKIIEMDINHIYNFPDPGTFQRLRYRDPEVQRIFERNRRVLSIRAPESPEVLETPESPTPGPSNANHGPDPGPEVPQPEVPQPEVPQPEVSPAQNAQNAEYGYFSDEDVPDKSLMIRLALTGEVLSLQLDRVLGRQAPPGPYILDHERNTNFGINVRFNHLRASMKNREKEVPDLNCSMSANVDHTRLISSEFLRASIQDDQTGQSDQSIYDRIDFSNPLEDQDDLNDNIQINYPETNESNFSDETGENYLTTSYPETSGTGLSENVSENYQADNEATGPGNDTTETGNYREEGEGIVSQILANEGVNSFALLYNDGNAHFQGSAPDSSFDLSAIEPYEEEFDTYGAYDDNESEDVLDLELPFKFEHEFE